MALFSTLKDKIDDLVIGATDLAVLAAPYGTTVPSTLTAADGSLLSLPAGWKSVGELDQKGAASITPDVKTTDIMGYGSMVPRRTIKTGEGVTIDFTAQEIRKMNLSLFWGSDLSATAPDAASGEWQYKKSSSAAMNYFSIIMIGVDSNSAGDIYQYWIFPKVAVTKSGKISLSTDGPQTFPITLTAYEDRTFGGYVAIGQGGLGNKANNAIAGFGTSLAKTLTITGSPTGGTFTVTVDSKVTGALPYNITAAQLQSALEGLTSVGEGGARVTAPTGNTFAVTLYSGNTTVTATASFTGGTTPNITVT
ncbi:hypothetical protein [Rhodococcus opacus]|uniref:Major tail protein n=1 Tax=Rhodococcus opacus TaxID=37919 RepID=A0A2S8JAU6_RHOOP|nr:hypothetical protein [Rhodococcus opacus]PQP24164.1 hypothetical protein C5613_14890 [Rhodococcus opacus]